MDYLITYAVYLSLISIVLILAAISRYKKRRNNQIYSKFITTNIDGYSLLAILIISIIVGFRYDVGADWYSYVSYFKGQKSINHMEIGYKFLNSSINDFGGNFTHLFFIVSFCSWVFIYKSIPVRLLPIGILFYFTDHQFFMSMNVIRQFLAISIVLYSYKYLLNEKYKFVLFILLASLFHRSALLMLPFVFIPLKNISTKRTTWSILFLASLMVANSESVTYVMELVVIFLAQQFTVFEIYENYLMSQHFQVQEIETSGSVVYFKHMIFMYIIYYSSKIIKKYPWYYIYYLLFFIGYIYYNIFGSIPILDRIADYFLILRPILLAITMYYVWTNSRNVYEKVSPLIVIMAYLIIFIRTIYIYPYKFIF